MSARDVIRKFFEENVGRIVTTQQIQRVAKISEYARRIRELRDDEGMQIQSFKDRPDLKSNQYVLVSLKRVPRFSHKIDKSLRAKILDRNGFTCLMCGALAGDSDPYKPERKITLQVHHIDPDGPTSESNLRTLCNNCNEGLGNLIKPPKQNTISVLRNIRKLPRTEQRLIYEDLKKRYAPPK